eukprot:4819357-Pleurochrysis_carterae.AAC.1
MRQLRRRRRGYVTRWAVDAAGGGARAQRRIWTPPSRRARAGCGCSTRRRPSGRWRHRCSKQRSHTRSHSRTHSRA